MNKKSDTSFEKNFKKLEEIVEKLEDEEISIDQALSLYEEGIKLSKLCIKKLEDARQKVEILSKDTDGNFKLKDFKTGEGQNAEE